MILLETNFSQEVHNCRFAQKMNALSPVDFSESSKSSRYRRFTPQYDLFGQTFARNDNADKPLKKNLLLWLLGTASAAALTYLNMTEMLQNFQDVLGVAYNAFTQLIEAFNLYKIESSDGTVTTQDILDIMEQTGSTFIDETVKGYVDGMPKKATRRLFRAGFGYVSDTVLYYEWSEHDLDRKNFFSRRMFVLSMFTLSGLSELIDVIKNEAPSEEDLRAAIGKFTAPLSVLLQTFGVEAKLLQKSSSADISDLSALDFRVADQISRSSKWDSSAWAYRRYGKTFVTIRKNYDDGLTHIVELSQTLQRFTEKKSNQEIAVVFDMLRTSLLNIAKSFASAALFDVRELNFK